MTDTANRKGSKDPAASAYRTSLPVRYALDRIFAVAIFVATVLGLVVLAILLIDVFRDGGGRLSWQFITSYPSRHPEQAGIFSALVGSIWVITLTAIISFPLGVGSAIFLEEFSDRDSRLARLIEINISNLAGVPSIIYGLLGLGLFVRFMEPVTGGRTILAGGLTLSLLVLPIVIISTREALRTVPDSLREGGYALGATRWQVIRSHVLPLALPGALTGTILALARAIGETAPLITLGALTYIAYIPALSPGGLFVPFTVLPIQIYNWISRPQEGFFENAAAGIVVLMVVLLLMNSVAILLRNKLQKRRS
jgi:phosphate transport system permease protein